MSGRTVSERKLAYGERLRKYCTEYKSVLTICADNVGSSQLQQVRLALRGRAVILMGKNTMIRTILRAAASTIPMCGTLINLVNGNIGFVFTNGDIAEIRKEIESIVEPAAAKAGALAPVKVVVPAGPTGMDPGQTSFFQAMGIATKIVRGQVEIVTAVNLLSPGEKVGNSEATLLSKLDIRPFFYGLKVQMIYDNGSVYSTEILDITQDDLRLKFLNGIRKLAAISLKIGYPTLASVPHSFANALKKIIALSVATDYTFEESEDIKLYLEDPAAWAAKNGVAAGAAAGAADAAKEESAPEPESEEESSEDGNVGGLFGSDSE